MKRCSAVRSAEHHRPGKHENPQPQWGRKQNLLEGGRASSLGKNSVCAREDLGLDHIPATKREAEMEASLEACGSASLLCRVATHDRKLSQRRWKAKTDCLPLSCPGYLHAYSHMDIHTHTYIQTIHITTQNCTQFSSMYAESNPDKANRSQSSDLLHFVLPLVIVMRGTGLSG